MNIQKITEAAGFFSRGNDDSAYFEAVDKSIRVSNHSRTRYQSAAYNISNDHDINILILTAGETYQADRRYPVDFVINRKKGERAKTTAKNLRSAIAKVACDIRGGRHLNAEDRRIETLPDFQGHAEALAENQNRVNEKQNSEIQAVLNWISENEIRLPAKGTPGIGKLRNSLVGRAAAAGFTFRAIHFAIKSL